MAEWNPKVKEYISSMLGKYTDDDRKALEAESEIDGADRLSAALAAIGAGFQGKDAGAAGQSRLSGIREEKKDALSSFDKGRAAKIQQIGLERDAARSLREDEQYALDQERGKRESDPTSQESILAQTLARKMVPSKDFSGMSAKQLNSMLPSMTKIYDIEQQKLNRADARADRFAMVDLRRQEKQEERDAKKKTTLDEVETRRQNILDNVALLKAQIKEDGTYEMFGSHNQDLDRRVEAIATDMAKLADPDSVARPAEVEAFKKGLIKSGFQNTNDTAQSLLGNFENELASRVDNAYRIRGIANPGQQKPGKTVVKTQTNQKTGERREVYDDGTFKILPPIRLGGG